MTTEEEVTKLRSVNNIQHHTITELKDQLSDAIILLIKLLPIANNRAQKVPTDERIISDVQKFLSDER